MQLLLLSNSAVYGGKPYSHAMSDIHEFVGGRPIVFVPFALADHDAYTAQAAEGLADFEVRGLHREPSATDAIEDPDVVLFVGGGNTFRLLKTLQDKDLLRAVRTRIRGGGRYMGASAGTCIAGETIRTTNDMPIVEPRGFDALGAVPFHFNCHYIDADPNSTHMGETRELRLQQFHEENSSPVMAMREGAWLSVDGERATFGGTTGGFWMEPGRPPRPLAQGDDLSAMVRGSNS